MLMSDPDRHVRKAAVVALSAVVHHKPGLVAAGLEQLLPQLFDQTEVKPEMVGESAKQQQYTRRATHHLLGFRVCFVRVHVDRQQLQVHECQV
jgi:hypothetical protein